jgi:hypothetical protein
VTVDRDQTATSGDAWRVDRGHSFRLTSAFTLVSRTIVAMSHVASSLRRLRVVAAPAVVILAALATGCTSPTSAERTARRTGAATLQITTDRDDYVLGAGDGAVVRFDVRNGGDETALVHSCGHEMVAVVEREENGAWAQHAGSMCVATLDMTPVPVAPGAAHDGGVRIDQPGRYRLRIEYGVGEIYIRHSALSPTFVVTR